MQEGALAKGHLKHHFPILRKKKWEKNIDSSLVRWIKNWLKMNVSSHLSLLGENLHQTSEYLNTNLSKGNQFISFMGYYMIKCISDSSNRPGSLWEITCFCLCWSLPADSVSLEGPDVDGVENSGLQTNQPVRGAVTSHGDLSTGALSGRVAQHVAPYLCLDAVPRNRHGVFCDLTGDQVGWSINVWTGRGRNKWRWWINTKGILNSFLWNRYRYSVFYWTEFAVILKKDV